jgi:thiamine kinase-like enzyme
VAEASTVTTAGERELRHQLRVCAATRSLADGRLTRIEGGLSNHAWCLEANGERWFARLGQPQAARLGVDRANECAVLRAAAAAGLAPAVHACEPSCGLLVTRFIDGRTWTAADVQRTGNLRRVGERLLAHDATAELLAERAAAAFARIGDGGYGTVMCHNDLHPLNLLDDGDRLWLVDWEYGGCGNPLFDVASFLALHDLGPAGTELFLDAYGRLPVRDRGHLEDARWLFDYVQWLWYRSRFPDPVGDEAWYAERLAQRLLRCNN